eukprot:CAMPEP_0201577854 /NCGR_PEP_ID=MMETSP0190_2-20130828/24412_1 /ASSEMBLY_ACC=CAM_ASM_000263 /TAXON_ID=37353 /ORGANISM="Rosalina sp." /LENGTH=506 /DNA_ID=CAMNT_0048010347 /DNA_START=256 /DNA_END=1776 /DNA_ORIENTATION=+
MQSNILEDLSSLRMIAKLIPEYCGGQDEESVSENAFNLLYALDEVITPMGYKENVTYKQIEDFVKMDSAEEKLSEIIQKSKEENAAEVMKKKADELAKQRAELRRKQQGGSPGSFGYKGLDALSSIGSKFRGSGQSGSGSYDNNNDKGVRSLSSATYDFGDDNGQGDKVRIERNDDYGGRKKYGNNDSDSDDNNKSSRKKKKGGGGKGMSGMSLKKKKNRDKLAKEAEELDSRTMDIAKYANLLESKSGGGDDDDFDASDLPPIEIMISEKLFVTFDRDGALKKFEIKGDMEVAVNDPSSTQCVIETNINPSKKLRFGKPTWRLHPRMNSSQWKKGILCLKDAQKKFRVGRSSKTSILKWRMTTSDDSNIPITIEFWPEAESNGTITVNAQYNCSQPLKNVIITFPTPSRQEPEISNVDNGDTAFYRNDGEFQWILNDLEEDTEGSLEYVVDDVQLEDLYPVSVHFEIENTYSQIEIKDVHDVDDEQKYEHKAKGTCVAEKYIVES